MTRAPYPKVCPECHHAEHEDQPRQHVQAGGDASMTDSSEKLPESIEELIRQVGPVLPCKARALRAAILAELASRDWAVRQAEEMHASEQTERVRCRDGWATAEARVREVEAALSALHAGARAAEGGLFRAWQMLSAICDSDPSRDRTRARDDAAETLTTLRVLLAPPKGAERTVAKEELRTDLAEGWR